MVLRTSVLRTPIRLRKPIHKEYCDCYGIGVMSIDGVPSMILGDGVDDRKLHEFLCETDYAATVYFTEDISQCYDSVMICLLLKIPVVIKTNKALPTQVLEEMRKVPHSGIHVSIDFLDDSLRTSLVPGASDISSLREMLFLAKSWKIFLALSVEYHPHLMSKLDLMEIVDLVKNYTSHMFLQFPRISDEYMHQTRATWESLRPGCMDLFKKYFQADVPSRRWYVKEQYKSALSQEIKEYLRGKKVSVETTDWDVGDKRIRHISSGLCKMPLGMRVFTFGKDNGIFVEAQLEGECTCNKCSLPII